MEGHDMRGHRMDGDEVKSGHPPDHDMSRHDMSAMDHAAMAHGADQASGHAGHGMPAGQGADAHAAHAGMQHDATHPGMHPGDLPAGAAPRTAIPALTDADRAAAFPALAGSHATHDAMAHRYVLIDRLEARGAGEGAWDATAWYGGDLHRLWLRSEGIVADGRIDHGSIEALYGRSITPWWDVVAGVRADDGDGPGRAFAAFGVQGLAPYKIEVQATAYVGRGRAAARLEAEYETLVTNRLILQWRSEANLYGGRDDAARHLGTGLSTVDAGARLRYEVTRRFAPYIGVEVERAFGDTAAFRRADGLDVQETRVVAGVRLWF
ncbi:copper resistance protein B [Cognatilysobacter segetis]|uniref:copper resistance protein B n=1 Tax=Cognatilysobacter segetis TaxID=2492394 RepID=UPI001EE4674A|nr:copper resistance protein B [Lysobacter segetis]